MNALVITLWSNGQVKRSRITQSRERLVAVVVTHATDAIPLAVNEKALGWGQLDVDAVQVGMGGRCACNGRTSPPFRKEGSDHTPHGVRHATCLFEGSSTRTVGGGGSVLVDENGGEPA